MAKKKFRINKKRMAITAIAIFVLIVMIFNIRNIVNLHIENRQLKESIKVNQQKKAEKEKELKNVNDPDYIEDQARKQLRMIKPGEQIYIVDQGENQDEEHSQDEEDKKEEEGTETGTGEVEKDEQTTASQ